VTNNTEQHRASLEQWREIEGYAASDLNDDYAACLLDIRARVEALEGRYETQRLATLEWGKDVENLQRWSDQHLMRIERLESVENCRQQDEDAERAVEPAPAGSLVEADRGRDMVRQALARWGSPAITPVPISERLPGPEDCDAEGRCWWGNAGGGGFVPSWRLCQRPGKPYFTHWLPHWVLPVPQHPRP